MKIKVMFITVLIVFCTAVLNSYALHELFRNVDSDSDGKISEEEFTEDMKGHVFGELDSDSSKVVSRAEWMAIESVTDEEKHKSLFEIIDRNKDFTISFIEFSNYAEMHSNVHEAFIGLDKNRSNDLSPDELTVRPLFKMITIRFNF